MTSGSPAGFRGIFRTDDAARAVYSEAAGIQRLIPLAVAVPADAEDLERLFEWARRTGTSLTPRGSGSSMAGGAIGPGVIVDLSGWKEIDSSSLDAGRVVVQPGVICGFLAEQLLARNLRLPVSPSSAAFCTIGGMTSANAAGAHSLAYGSMREWVTAVEIVLADGSRTWVRRGEPHPMSDRVLDVIGRDDQGVAHDDKGVLKNSSGYAVARFRRSGDLVDLIVGSEGTLGFITRVELRLAAVPAFAASVMGVFDSLEAATDAAIGARAAGAAACELLDRTYLDFVGGEHGDWVRHAQAVLLSDVEGATSDEVEGAAEAVVQSFSDAGAAETHVARAAADRQRLWELRHAASPTLARLGDSLKSMQFIEDAAVPPRHLGAYVAGVRAALEHQETRGVIFGHAGDAHVHVNPLVDVTHASWRARVEAILAEVTDLVASLGGTLSGEHGDGRLRTPLLDRTWDGASLAAFAAVKKVFDPEFLLNPGVKVDGLPLGDVKYDPSLGRLPTRAAEALSEVERTRSYGVSRLALLDDDRR